MRRTIVVLLALSAFAGEKPVPGPPWGLDYPEARRQALAAGKPIFIYFTKTS